MRLKTRATDQAVAAWRHDTLAVASDQVLNTAQVVERWSGREQFVILDTAFNFGEKFLVAWQAWRADKHRARQLHYLAFDAHPYDENALRAAHDNWPELKEMTDALCLDWPLAMSGMHRVLLPERGISLTLIFGTLEHHLPQVEAAVDAFLFDAAPGGSGSDKTIGTWFARLAQPQAVVAFSAQAALPETVQEHLQEAGFVGAAGSLRAEFKPRRPVEQATPSSDRSAIVIGAGVAGAAMCQRLCTRGWDVTLIEQHAGAAQGASGNLAGVFMPVLSRDDGPAARLSRTAFLFALRLWREIGGIGTAFDGAGNGVLQLARAGRSGAYPDYPPEFARRLEADEICRLIPALTAGMAFGGTQSHAGAWLFERGGWAHPGGVCVALLSACGAQLRRIHQRTVAQLLRIDGRWQVMDEGGMPIAQAGHVIIANGIAGNRFTQTRELPLAAIRGQVTHVAADLLPDLPMPICGDGYVIPARGEICCVGATYDADTDARLRTASQDENLARLLRLFPQSAAQMADLPLAGRVGLRCVSPDRLPLVGAMPDFGALQAMRGERLRDVPRHAGLHCLLAYASRGLTWAPLAAELLAAQICCEPVPLERDLCATIDPARFALQALRRAKNKS
jgi:tRNA 5-methylaminomethyl-2-thiouridine biosynthesis bifunctional protein